MTTFTWLASVLMGIAAGFLAGILFQQKYLAPPPIVYHTPPVRVEPSALTTNCVELARACYARKRAEAVR